MPAENDAGAFEVGGVLRIDRMLDGFLERAPLDAAAPQRFQHLAECARRHFARVQVRNQRRVRVPQKLEASRRSAPLFDTAGRVRELEACFEGMLQVSDQSRSRL